MSTDTLSIRGLFRPDREYYNRWPSGANRNRDLAARAATISAIALADAPGTKRDVTAIAGEWTLMIVLRLAIEPLVGRTSIIPHGRSSFMAPSLHSICLLDWFVATSPKSAISAIPFIEPDESPNFPTTTTESPSRRSPKSS